MSGENVLTQDPEPNPATVSKGEEAQAPAEDNIKVTAVPADEPAEEPGEEEAKKAESEEEKKAETAEEEEKKRVDKEPEPDEDTQAKIEKLEKKIGYEMRQRKKLEKQLARQNKPAPEKDLEAPNRDDFDTFEDYDAARIKYEVQKGIHEYQKEQKSNDVEDDLDEYISEVLTSGIERYSDFKDKATAEGAPHLPITKPMLKIMQDNEVENPEGIIYYLANNLKECQSISRMSPVGAARALSKIEDKVAHELKKYPGAHQKTQVKKVTKAPEPIKPTSSAGVISKDPSEMSQAEYEKWRTQGGGA